MKGMNKIAVVVFSTYPSDVRVRREAETLQESGAQVEVICYRKKGQKRKETINNVIVHRLKASKKRSGKFRYMCEYISFLIRSFFKLNHIYFKSFHNIIHVHNMPEFLVFSATIQKLLGSRIILDMHDPMPEVYMTKYGISHDHIAIKLLRWLERISIKFAHVVITPNKAFRDRFIERGCPADKIHIVMNSPKEESFLAGLTESRPRDDGRFVIMYHGTLVERHGLATALEALALLRERIPNLLFKVFGDGEYVNEFQRKIAELRLEKVVQYFGFVENSEISKVIPTIDVGIIPNKKSPFTEINLPVRIFEYLCYHKPVIVPRTTGIRDYFDEGSINFFEAGNAESLANAIFNIYQNPAGQQEILEKGQQIYRQYRWHLEGENFVRIVNGLSSNPKTGNRSSFRVLARSQRL